MSEIRSGRRTVEISNPDKVLFPDPGYTKLDLATYYAEVAPVMLPHVRDRPMNLHVFPQGVDKRGFFLQDVPDHFPDWIGRITVPKRGGTVTHAVAREPATLPYMAGQNVITPHLWSSRTDKLDRPDHLVRQVAQRIHDHLGVMLPVDQGEGPHFREVTSFSIRAVYFSNSSVSVANWMIFSCPWNGYLRHTSTCVPENSITL